LLIQLITKTNFNNTARFIDLLFPSSGLISQNIGSLFHTKFTNENTEVVVVVQRLNVNTIGHMTKPKVSKHWRKPVGLSDKAWIPPAPLHHVTIIQL